jgi:hypothetical protein
MNTAVPNQPNDGNFIDDEVLQQVSDAIRVFGVETLLEKLDTEEPNDFNWYPWEIF